MTKNGISTLGLWWNAGPINNNCPSVLRFKWDSTNVQVLTPFVMAFFYFCFFKLVKTLESFGVDTATVVLDNLITILVFSLRRDAATKIRYRDSHSAVYFHVFWLPHIRSERSGKLRSRDYIVQGKEETRLWKWHCTSTIIFDFQMYKLPESFQDYIQSKMFYPR